MSVFTGTGMAPILIAPQNVPTNSGASRQIMTTRSSMPTPSSSSALPARLASGCTSPYESTRSSYENAGALPRPSSTLRSTNQLAALNCAGNDSQAFMSASAPHWHHGCCTPRGRCTMKKSLFAAVLATLMMLGISAAAIAQTDLSGSASSAQAQSQSSPGDKSAGASSSSSATAPKPDDPKSSATSPSSPSAAQAPSPSSSSSTTVDVKPGDRGASTGGGD